MTMILFLLGVLLGAAMVQMRGRVQKLEREIEDLRTALGKGPAREQASVADDDAARSSVVAPFARSVAPDAAPRRPAVIIRDAPPTAVTPVQRDPAPATMAADVQPRRAGEREAQEPRPPAKPVAARPGFGIRFEDIFGRRLPIWAGGITLAVAGVLLAKYSIDAGLLSPAIRVILGLLFGFALIGGAEIALRFDTRIADPRVRQALAGAGIASLYAAIVAATNLYDLVGPGMAFAGLAMVTMLALALSIRFGAPSALLGLVGGLAAPALVGEGAPNVPLLSAYLALAIGGLTALSRQQRWMWLGVSALIGGAGWGGILILTGALDWATSLSLGLLLLLLGLVLPLFAFSGTRARLFRSVAAVAAAAQIALLVAKGGFAPLQWGLYLLLAAALGWMAWREERFRLLPPIALAVGLLLSILWPQPSGALFSAVMLALITLHAGPALARLWRPGSSLVEAGQVAAASLVGHAVAWGQFADAGDTLLGVLAIGAALVPGIGAAMGWRREERQGDARFVLLVATPSLLLAEAAYLLLPHWLLPVAVAAIAAGLVLLARAATDRRIEHAALGFLMVGVAALLATDPMLGETSRLGGEIGRAPMGQALLRWAAVAAAAGIGAWRITHRKRGGVEAVAALLAYGAAAQVAPAWSLPVIASIGLLGGAEAARRGISGLRGAAAVALGMVALLWAAGPFSSWLEPALASIGGPAMLAHGLAPLPDIVTRLVIPAVAGALALWRIAPAMDRRLRRFASAIVGSVGLAAAHSLYKQIFHIDTMAEMIRLGMAERTIWEGLLLGASVLRWRRGVGIRLAGAGAAAALIHGLYYGLLLFNPLWTEVAVGPWPLANWLVPAFAILFGSLWLLDRTVGLGRPLFHRGASILRMLLILLLAILTLRQCFAGSVLVSVPIGPVENIGWSVLAIAFAIAFLIWGIRSGRHDWRIGSLVLMLGAVAKVFLLDAAGLEGLLRIASFLALGFSLIGLGWLYSRFLRDEAG